MSKAIQTIGIIIVIVGAILAMITVYTASSEVGEISLQEALSTERFLSYMTKYIGQALIVVFGVIVYVIGIKLERRSSPN